MNRFDMTYFYGPPAGQVVRPEVLGDILASGMTLLPLFADTKTNRETLRLLAELDGNARANVFDPRFRELYLSEDAAAVDSVVKAVVEDYRGFDNIAGWDIVDEPGAANFPILGEIVAALRKYSPEKETVINLFPNYATQEQLGTPDYEQYLEEFIRVVKPDFLSYDHYHFLGRDAQKQDAGEVEERERLIREAAQRTDERPGFFANAEIVRTVSQRRGIPAMMIALLVEHGPYRNLTREELLWEANMCLCYGFKRLSYFTYWEPEHDDFWRWTNAMCDTEGKKTQHYYDVQTITSALCPVGEYLYPLRSTQVYHLGSAEPGCRVLSGPADGLPAIEGEDGVVGCFEDGSFYLVNRSFLEENSFVIRSERVSRFDPEQREFAPLSPEDGCVRVRLGAGEGVLLR